MAPTRRSRPITSPIRAIRVWLSASMNSSVRRPRIRSFPGDAGAQQQWRGDMSNKWYSRPVLFVADIDRSVDFYVKQLGFTVQWRFVVEGNACVAQVARPGCEFILESETPDKTGKGVMFISLDEDVLNALRA